MSLESKIEALTVALEANTAAILGQEVIKLEVDESPIKGEPVIDQKTDDEPVDQKAAKPAKMPTKAALEKVTGLCAEVARQHDRKTVKDLITGLGGEKLGDLNAAQVKELTLLLAAL